MRQEIISNILYFGLTCTGPFLALVYALAALAFRAAWHECSWLSMNRDVGCALTFLVANIAYSVALVHPGGEGDPKVNAVILSMVVLVSWGVSIMNMVNIYRQKVQGRMPDLEPYCLEERVILITGSNGGIGKESAKLCLKYGARTVIFACRSKIRAESAIDEIANFFDIEKDSEEYFLRFRFLSCDLSSLESVRQAVKTFESWDMPLHILVNNAGIMMGHKELSKDRYEMTMACNHLGHFLLTTLLLPKLRDSAKKFGKPSRVINLTSSTYTLASSMDLDDLFCDKSRPYTLFGQYAQSKLANILFTNELARREQQLQSSPTRSYGDVQDSPGSRSSSSSRSGSALVNAYAVHPGLVRTDVVRNMPWYLYYPNKIFGVLMVFLQKSPEAGAYTTLYCVASEEIAVKHVTPSSCFFSNCAEEQLWPVAQDVTKAKELWILSEHLVTKTDKNNDMTTTQSILN